MLKNEVPYDKTEHLLNQLNLLRKLKHSLVNRSYCICQNLYFCKFFFAISKLSSYGKVI